MRLLHYVHKDILLHEINRFVCKDNKLFFHDELTHSHIKTFESNVKAQKWIDEKLLPTKLKML